MHHKLYVHDRNRIVRSLDAPVIDALEAVFRDRAVRWQVASAAIAVRNLADRRHWLACGCTHDLSNPPILFPRRTKRTVSLVRAAGRAGHREGCPFSRGKVDMQTGQEESGKREAHANTPMTKPWRLGGRPRREQTFAQGGGDVSERIPGSSARRMPKMGRILMTLLQAAGLDSADPGNIEKATFGEGEKRRVFPKLCKAAAYQPLEALGSEETADGLTLGETVCLVPSRLYKMLSQARASLSKHQSATRYLLVMADRVEGDHLYYQHLGKEMKLKLGSRPRMFGVEDGTKGPYWTLVRFSVKSGSSFSEAVETYMHPAVSRAIPIPVDSRLERFYLKRLLEQVMYWRDKSSDPMAVKLFKPLFDSMVDDEPCRPDVILETERGNRLVIEIMGMKEDPDYLARKAVTHGRMRRLGKVHDLLEIDDKTDWRSFRKELTGKMYAAHRAA